MKKQECIVPHIVKEYQIGNATVQIADNYCRGKTKEEVDAILETIARNALPYLQHQMEKKVPFGGGTPLGTSKNL